MPDFTTYPDRLAEVVKRIIERLMNRTAVYAADRMVVPGGKNLAVQSDRLTTRSSRLLRGLQGARGLNWSSAESVRSFRVVGAILQAVWEILVPYAAIHEYGGTINHPGGTPFWVDEKGAHFMKKDGGYPDGTRFTAPHQITMPARSYIRPALDDLQPDIYRVAHEEFLKEFGLA